MKIIATSGIATANCPRVKFARKTDVTRFVHESEGTSVLIGLGKEEWKTSAYGDKMLPRRIVKVVTEYRIPEVIVNFFDFRDLMRASDLMTAEILGEQFTLAGYKFSRYQSEPGFVMEKIHLENVPEGAVEALNRGIIIGECTNDARDLGNTPTSDMNPQDLEDAVEALIAKYGLGLRVGIKTAYPGKGGDDTYLSLLDAVGRGAEVRPRIIVLSYWADDDGDKPPIAYVGKGITYDTGGHDLKSTDNMAGMEYDMLGGAAVIAAVLAAARLDIKQNIIGIIPTAENAIGPKAYHPGDIITSQAGISVAVDNTDAEGRLVLADGMTHAMVEYKPRVVVTIATLTGGAHRAMGDEISAIFGLDSGLVGAMCNLGWDCGTFVAPLPYVPEIHDKYLESDIADMSNVRANSNPYGSAIAGAAFVHRFAKKLNVPRFLHLDIASRMKNAKDELLAPGTPGEPTGLLVRALSIL